MSENILERIISEKRREVAAAKAAAPIESVKAIAAEEEPPRGFRRALLGEKTAPPRIIAEIKKASPSKGLIRADFDPVAIARAYESAGAAAISVLTDAPFFQGSLDYLRAVHDAVRLPLLRKDFMIDPYQVWEARAAGADAILLIVAALEDSSMVELDALARELGMDVLVEVHNADELERARKLGPDLVGVNNRNLKTFEVSLETTRSLLPARPADALMVSESGFFERSEIEAMRGWGVDAFLIGESLMCADDIGQALEKLLESRA